MKTIALAFALLAVFARSALASGDVDNAHQIGEIAKQSGLAVDYDVSGWNSYVDMHVSSMLPGDARSVAGLMCQYAHTKQTWEHTWTVRVFLVTGERPAAQCTTK